MSITGYATSRSPLTAWTQLLAQKLTRTAEGVLSVYCVTYLGHSNLITCLTSFFLEKKSCQTPKKKKKKVIFGVLRTKVFLKFSVRLQKKKKVQVLGIFFVSVI